MNEYRGLTTYPFMEYTEVLEFDWLRFGLA